jgi:hypothetical protein
MFDKNGAFVVMKLEQVQLPLHKDDAETMLKFTFQLLPLSFGPEALPPRVSP